VPSSISSSEASDRSDAPFLSDDALAQCTAVRARALDVDTPFSLALAVLLLVMIAGEIGVRAKGYRASVTDDAALFALERHRASTLGDDVVVLLGKSRLQLGFDRATWNELMPTRPVVQLALHGQSAWAPLASLAADPAFTGTILFSFTEEDLTRGARDQALPLVDDARAHASFFARAETWMRAQIQSRLALVNPQVSLSNVLASVLEHGELPEPHFTVTHSDRTQRADFSRTDAALLRAHYDGVRADADRALRGRPVDDTRWLSEAREVLPLIALLRARGAHVVFIKFLHCDDADTASERWFPRERFFDVIAREASVPALHYRDLPEWQRFTCPDSSHLDEKDAPAFTRHFVETLRGRGMLSRAASMVRVTDPLTR